CTVRRKAGGASPLQVFQGSTLLRELPVSSAPQTQASGGGGASPLTVAFSNGTPTPAGGITYDGAGAASANLVLKGPLPTGSFLNEVDTPTGPNSGTISLDGSTITYTNATRIIDTTPVTNFRIEGPANAAVNIVDDPNGTENGFPAAEVNSPAFAKVDFANKTNVTADVNGSTTVQAAPKGTSTTINVSNVLGHPSIPVTLGQLDPITGLGTLKNFRGPVTISGPGPNVELPDVVINDFNDTQPHTVFVTPSQITGLTDPPAPTNVTAAPAGVVEIGGSRRPPGSAYNTPGPPAPRSFRVVAPGSADIVNLQVASAGIPGHDVTQVAIGADTVNVGLGSLQAI